MRALVTVLMLVACAAPEAVPAPAPQLVRVELEPSGSSCPAGGQRIQTGTDANLSGVLDPEEVTATAFVCSGQDGADGSDGADGTDGSDPTALLVRTEPELPGARCPNGGVVVLAGPDLDGDGALADSEVSSSSVACAADASRALVRVDLEPPGTRCADGGLAVHAGLDDDGDGALSNPEIDTTTYWCGAPLVPSVFQGSIQIWEGMDTRWLDGLQVITGDLTIEWWPNDTVSLPSLHRIGGTLTSWPEIRVFDLPELVEAGWMQLRTPAPGGASLDVARLARVEEISIDHARAVHAPLLEVGVVRSSELLGDTIAFASLTTGLVVVDGAPNLIEVDAPSLVDGHLAVIDAPRLMDVNLSSLVQGGIHLERTAMTSIDLPSLQRADVSVLENADLSMISAPALIASDHFAVVDNPRLPTCAVLQLAQQASVTTPQISGNDDGTPCD